MPKTHASEKPQRPRRVKILLAYGPAELTDAEVAQLKAICPSPLFLRRVADLAGEWRAKAAHEAALPSQGEIVANLRALVRRAEAIQRDATALAEEIAGLDEMTRAALLWSGHRAEEAALRVLNESVQLRELVQGAKAAINERGPLPRGPRPQVALRRAGAAVRALFRRHRLQWSVSVERELARDSAAVCVFRIITGAQGCVEDYLPDR